MHGEEAMQDIKCMPVFVEQWYVLILGFIVHAPLLLQATRSQSVWRVLKELQVNILI